MNPTTTTHPHHSGADSHYVSMSELDSFSDSDWLDIASNRESDTDDSLDQVDTTSASLSRRSSFSVGSSRDGEVDAWEGFVEGVSDDTGSNDPNRAPSPPHDNEAEHTHNPRDIRADAAEDRRVMVGLEQSLISTLSASRTSSLNNSTVHSSLRDLRLSFPDPLTSSNDELNGLYDCPSVPPPVDEVSSADVTITDENNVVTPIEDPGLTPTPEVKHEEETVLRANATSDVVLYGTRSPHRWAFVHDLLTKVAEGSGRVLNVGDRTNDEIEQVNFVRKPSEPFLFRPQHVDTILVQDRTDGSVLPSSESSPSRPSLAIVFLPCNPASIPLKHTSYLPLVSLADSAGDSHEATTSLQARIAWAQCHVPEDRVVELVRDSEVLPAEGIKDLNPVCAYRSLRSFTEKQQRRVGLQVVTIFALLSLIVGFSVNTVFRAHTREATSTGFSSYSSAAPTKVSASDTITNSTALAVRITSDLFVVAPSLSSMPPAYERGSTSLDSASTSIVACTRAVANIPNTVKSLTEKVKSSKDVIIRSSSTTLTEASTSHVPVASTVTTSSERETSAVAHRVVDSLSEIVEVAIKAVVEVLHHDFAEMLMAVNELVNSIHRRTRMVVKQSKNTVQIVREQFHYRNERAKNKARELTEKGFRLASYAGNAFVGRTHVAKKRAQSLKEEVASSEAWAHYRRAHGEWSEALGRGTQGKHGHRCRSLQPGSRHGAACH
ncbi:hypothetical protein PM082_016031 [Marasmius tenuissimus]|nr:hypothetical protein PM082_016031 [Marasmius tenuissimus]